MRVVITGASRGLGKEFLRHYLADGDEVHAVTRNPERLSDVTAKKLHLHRIDLESPNGPAELSRALKGLPVDLLINNAGVFLDREASFTELPIDIVRKSFEVNTLLPMRVCQALLPNLLAMAKSTGHRAHVCQISSLMGSITDNQRGASYGYRMSKAALNMFNRSFSIDYPNIVSIVLHPGWVKTDMGGKGATTSIEDSVAGMTRILKNLTPEQTGKFYDFEGDELPW